MASARSRVSPAGVRPCSFKSAGVMYSATLALPIGWIVITGLLLQKINPTVDGIIPDGRGLWIAVMIGGIGKGAESMI